MIFRSLTVAALCWAPLAQAADRAYTPYASVKGIIETQADLLPAGLIQADQAQWTAWSRREDKTIRARLQQGDLDSLVNLLLLGTSFTKQPRIRVEDITEASQNGVLRARVDDLVAGLKNPGSNERLVFLSGLLRREGVDPGSSGRFIFNELQRVLQERITIARRAAEAKPGSLLDRVSLFSDRGVSLDTSIFPDFSIDAALRDLKQRGVLREGQVARVGVIGPGLDFIDKNDESGYDYYPQQTVQPFALYDSLLRLGLAKGSGVKLSILDISPRVIGHIISHIEHARDLAKKNAGYVIQLPRDVSRPWPPAVVSYWRSLGDRAGTSVAPIRPPEIFKGLETRAVRIRPEVVLACEPVDLNIVLERLNLAEPERFDLLVATNVFLYYGAFEQMLALENAGAMLKRGGLLLTNDRLPEVPGGTMRQAGMTEVLYDERAPGAREVIGWYQKQ